MKSGATGFLSGNRGRAAGAPGRALLTAAAAALFTGQLAAAPPPPPGPGVAPPAAGDGGGEKGAAPSSAALAGRAEPPPLALVGPVPEPVEAPSAGEVEEGLEKGVSFLLGEQNKNGSWGSPTRTKGLNIYAPVPGAHHAFRAATTALAVASLIEVRDPRPEAQAALERGEEWLLAHLPNLRRANPTAIYNVWGHAFGIQALVRMHGRLPEDAARRARIEKVLRGQIGLLKRYEVVDGGWAYYDFEVGSQKPSGSSISFVTATVLVALDEARALGIEMPRREIDRGVRSIHRQRKPDFTYAYGEYLKMRPQHGINLPGGSLGRSQACNFALRRWGDRAVTDDVLKTWLNRLFARNDWLGIGRKRPVPHESWFAVAGYFYYYGHYYAARCIEELPDAERPAFQAHLAKVLLQHQEKTGSWWDYPLYDYGPSYGTAFGLMALVRCR